jgi:hypothetical protein
MNYRAKSDGHQAFFRASVCVLFSSRASRPINSLKTLKNQLLTGEKNGEYTPVQKRSFLTDEKNVRDRLLELIGEESIAAFSRLTRVPESSLRAYLTRGIKPGMDHSVAIAEAKGITVDWLATGHLPKLRSDIEGIDKVRMQTAVSAVQIGLQAAKKQVTPDRHAELICAAYDLTKRMDRAEIVQIITAFGV